MGKEKGGNETVRNKNPRDLRIEIKVRTRDLRKKRFKNKKPRDLRIKSPEI